MGFRVSESVLERFWEALGSGLSPTAAATRAGVHGATGRRWAADAGYLTDPKHRGVRYSQGVKDRLWEALHAGASVTEAAVVAGMSEVSAQYWVNKAGYVPRTAVPADIDAELRAEPAKGSLSFVERCRLEQLLEAGHAPMQAAGLLGRHRGTINREMARGRTVSGYCVSSSDLAPPSS